MTITCLVCGTENPDTNINCFSCGETLVSNTASFYLPNGTILSSSHCQYKIEKSLGKGGFGITYKAIELQSSTQVAIKESWIDGSMRQGTSIIYPMNITPQARNKQIDEVFREAQNLYKCPHPNIVKVYEWFAANNTAYIVMELISGKSLYDLLQQQGKLSESQVTKYLISICEALKQIHSIGLLHRDIKPENILIDSQDRPVLIDFGNAREYIANKTQTMSVIVSQGYAPIEQYGQQQKRDHRLDIYALCATMYELITGQMPPSAPDRLQNDPLIPPSKIPNIQISPVLENVILKGMKMNVSERFDTIEQLIEGLKGNPPEIIKARELIKQNKFQEAMQLYWQCVNQFNHYQVIVELAMICIYVDDFEAEKASKQAIQLYPNDGRGYGVLGLVNCRRKNWSEAVNNLQQAANLAPSQGWIHGNLGWALGKIGNWQEAQSAVNQALQIEPESVFLLGLNAWISLNLKQYQYAIRYAKPALFKARQLSNNTVLLKWIYPCLAIALINDLVSQNSSELITCINNFTNHVPQSAWSWGLKGWYEAKKGLEREANQSFSQANLHQNCPNWVILNQGLILEKQNNLQLAINMYENCVQKMSNSALVYYRLGTLLGKVNQWQRAKDLLEKAIQLDPNLAEVYHNLGWVLLNLKDGNGNLLYSNELLVNYRKAVGLYRQQNKLNIVQILQQKFQLINVNI